MLFYSNLVLQQGNILLWANISPLIAIHCCKLTIKNAASKYSIVCEYFLAASRRLLCANMSQLQSILCCMLIMYWSKVILSSCAYISLLLATSCCELIINCSKVIFLSGANFPCCKPYVVGNRLSCTNISGCKLSPYQTQTPHPPVLCIIQQIISAV